MEVRADDGALTTRRRFLLNDADLIDGYACPIDPMDALQCESCQ